MSSACENKDAELATLTLEFILVSMSLMDRRFGPTDDFATLLYL